MRDGTCSILCCDEGCASNRSRRGIQSYVAVPPKGVDAEFDDASNLKMCASSNTRQFLQIQGARNVLLENDVIEGR